MKKTLPTWLMAFPLLVSACAQPKPPTAEAENPAKQSLKGAETQSRSPQLEVSYGGFDGLRYKRILIAGPAGVVRSINDEYGRYEKREDLSVSPGGEFALVHQVDAGYAVAADEAEPHERHYCVFISLVNACVVARETGSICDGRWSDEGGSWTSYSAGEIDLNTWPISASRIASGEMHLAGSPEADLTNLRFCDPPSPQNREAYKQILDKLKNS
jgi:hypothetical protein